MCLTRMRWVVLVAPLIVACGAKPGNARTIGGIVSGLTGTGLVLQVNGGLDLSVPANATTFQFGAQFVEGIRYTVTVLSQPTSHAEVCSVVNAVGSVGTADVADVGVICSTDAHTVGGTVSGLAGPGLALQLNQVFDLARSGDGSFTFPTKVARGATYKVTVTAEPANPPEACTVENGTGTVASGDITDVTVTCSTHTYSVGGSVRGLAGSGLVLQLNGQYDLAVTSSTFTFSRLARGASYAISVARQPTGPVQNCAVANATGTVADADVTAVLVTCTTVLLAEGAECAADDQCASSHCSCGDASCAGAHQTCSALPCGSCRYTTTGASCDGLVADGTGCSDGSACTTGDRCSAGSCVATGTLACDDGNPCTDDTCDLQKGCVHVNNTAPCSDGNACTTGDHCSGGSCVTTGSLSCDDGNPCTDDTCNPATSCAHVNNTNWCDDGNPCTYGDRCSGGHCAAGTAYTCGGDVCTAASACDGNGGCTPTAPQNEGGWCGNYACNEAPCYCWLGACDCSSPC